VGAHEGNRGETCGEAIRDSLQSGEKVSFPDLYDRVRKRGGWKDETIWQHLMSCVVNLPPARKHWKSSPSSSFIQMGDRALRSTTPSQSHRLGVRFRLARLGYA